MRLIARVGLKGDALLVISDLACSRYSFRCVACMDSVHGFGAWIRCIGMGIAKEKQETMDHGECINTAVCKAIALRPIHLLQSLLRKHCIFFGHPPRSCPKSLYYLFPACVYIYVYICIFTPGLYRIDMGWQWA